MWNFRVVCGDDGIYSFHEVYYGADGQPDSWAARLVTPRGFAPEFDGDEGPVDSLRRTLNWMLKGLDKPILDECGDKLVERKE